MAYIPRVVLAPRKLSDGYAWGRCMGGASWRIGEGGSPGGKIVWSEHDSAEGETAARRHVSQRTHRTTAERDGMVREVDHNLVGEFLR
jgi:hypothetical protein